MIGSDSNSIICHFFNSITWANHFLYIYVYKIGIVTTYTSSISVIVNWNSWCSTVVALVSCLNSIWYYSTFPVLSLKIFLFISYPFMSHRFSDYLKTHFKKQVFRNLEFSNQKIVSNCSVRLTTIRLFCQ